MMEMSDENFALLLISTKHHVRLIVLLFCGFISMNAWAPYQHDFDYFSNISFLLLQIEYIVKVEKYWYCAVESLSEIFLDAKNIYFKQNFDMFDANHSKDFLISWAEKKFFKFLNLILNFSLKLEWQNLSRVFFRLQQWSC